MNKYMRRGFWLVILGIAFVLLGYYLMDDGTFKYGWAMIAGVVVFGIGFLTIIYSLMRKIERKAILEERASEAGQEET